MKLEFPKTLTALLLFIGCVSSSFNQEKNLDKNKVPNYNFDTFKGDCPAFLLPNSSTSKSEGYYFNELKFNRTDSSETRNPYHGLSFELLGPYFIPNIGYSYEKPVKKDFSTQFDFRIAGFAFPHSVDLSWGVGPSLAQSLLFGRSFCRLRAGLSEGVVFNPPSINGKFDSMQPWDRPARVIFFLSGNLGCELQVVKDQFFITPEVNLVLGNRMKYTSKSPDNAVRVTGALPVTFGIDLKFRL